MANDLDVQKKRSKILLYILFRDEPKGLVTRVFSLFFQNRCSRCPMGIARGSHIDQIFYLFCDLTNLNKFKLFCNFKWPLEFAPCDALSAEYGLQSLNSKHL